ncbi:MAG: hypothetical protein HY716_05425 [Planctomycetes bacterium]|nr:hypothetical protein [Planctomycetota bacterium]
MTSCLMILIAAGFVCGGVARAATLPAAIAGNSCLPEGVVEQEGNFDTLHKMRQERNKKAAEAADLVEAAHEALDRFECEEAIETHKKAMALRAEVEASEAAIERLTSGVIHEIFRDLKEGNKEVRTRATTRLVELGPEAVVQVAELLKSSDLDSDVQARVRKIINQIGNVEIDESGLWGQWAVDAEASSEYGRPNWSAQQACGKPNTMQAGDQQTAWATKQQDAGAEWLQLSYEFSVRPARVRIHETFNPGAVVKIEAQDAEKRWHVLWKGKDETRDCPGWLDVRFDPPKFGTRVIRITLDTSLVAGWNEIDAVQFLGEFADIPASK